MQNFVHIPLSTFFPPLLATSEVRSLYMTLGKTQAPAQLCELQVGDPPAARTHLPRSELQVLRGLPISTDAQRRHEGLMAWASVFFSSH